MKLGSLRFLAFAIACLFMAWLVFALWQQHPVSAVTSPVTTSRIEVPPVVTESKKLTILSDTPFERGYGRKGGTQEEDFQLVEETLLTARTLIKDHSHIPMADNRDFTAFLTGKNRDQLAWISPDHPAINQNGELTDRWGHPVFFHQESSESTSLRSAGPDGVMWNDDDIVLERSAVLR